ncbi:hypothetical protein PFLA_a2506 [Pseudoalteromonas flavipulchra NCIMB 2033 = ATCC BAA-314]|nr:hypothetical protein [Pseudoalteromonas flavipulchra NCIMB 2033 = ATCC BAA-314]
MSSRDLSYRKKHTVAATLCREKHTIAATFCREETLYNRAFIPRKNTS